MQRNPEEARPRGCAADEKPKGDWLQTRQPSNTPAFGFTQPQLDQIRPADLESRLGDGGIDVGAEQPNLLAQLDRARARLDASVLLLEQALDLRELLWWQCDLDDARADVNALKYAYKAHRWWRSQ